MPRWPFVFGTMTLLTFLMMFALASTSTVSGSAPERPARQRRAVRHGDWLGTAHGGLQFLFQDHGGGLEVEVHHVAHDGVHRRRAPARRSWRRARTCCRRTPRVAPSATSVSMLGARCQSALEAADEELLVDDHDDDGQQQLRQAHGDVVAVIKRRQRPAPHHVAHGKIHQHEQKAQRPDQSLRSQLRRLVVVRAALGVRRPAPALCCAPLTDAP